MLPLNVVCSTVACAAYEPERVFSIAACAALGRVCSTAASAAPRRVCSTAVCAVPGRFCVSILQQFVLSREVSIDCASPGHTCSTATRAVPGGARDDLINSSAKHRRLTNPTFQLNKNMHLLHREKKY
jgi:hypothetical protein